MKFARRIENKYTRIVLYTNWSVKTMVRWTPQTGCIMKVKGVYVYIYVCVYNIGIIK